MKKKKNSARIKLGRALCYILATAVIIGACGYIVGRIVFKGPSEKLSAKATESLLEVKGLSFVPSVFLSAEEIAAQKTDADIGEEATEPDTEETPAPEETDPPEETPAAEEGPQPDAYGYIDEDGDGIITDTLTYKGSTVYLLIVLDPSRVFTATAIQDPAQQYGYGITLADMINANDAVGGINAGGFVDVSGVGSGWPPYGITYSNGQCFNPDAAGPIGAFDSNNILHVGYYSGSDCEGMGIRDAVSFGPVLISKGEKKDDETLKSNIGARTAIGQREDKAVVMMAVDGRQAYSIGLTYGDCADVLLEKCGCINAINLDGGNSTCMMFNGEMVNNPANPAGGTRNLPTAWLIRK